MTGLEQWALRHKITPEALRELTDLQTFSAPTDDDKSEQFVQSIVRMEAARKDIYLWRNNVGAGTLENGGFIRWGLANESKSVNCIIKSGDLIGIRKRHIVQSDVGTVIGQFISRECKRSQKAHIEPAQVRWSTLINANGGDAKIVNGPGSFD